MSDIELLRILSIQAREKRKDHILFRSYCYSIVVTFLLSKEIFTGNPELEFYLNNDPHIQKFLDQNEIELKPYLFKSRTQIVARFTRVIENAEHGTLIILLKSIDNVIFHKPKKSSNIKNDNEENYFDSLLKQF